MAYVVEDGSIVTGATSYISLADARAYAADRGLSLPTDDTACEQALVRAVDYLDGEYGPRLQGARVSVAQQLEWPRYSVRLHGFPVGADEVPVEIAYAQVQVAVQIGAGVELEPSGSASPVKREKVGSLETEYQTSGGSSIVPRVVAAERLMRPFLNSGGALRTVRA